VLELTKPKARCSSFVEVADPRCEFPLANKEAAKEKTSSSLAAANMLRLYESAAHKRSAERLSLQPLSSGSSPRRQGFTPSLRALDRCGPPPERILIAGKAAKRTPRTAKQCNESRNKLSTHRARFLRDSRTNRARFVQKICAFRAESWHDSCRKRARFVHESGTELAQEQRQFGPRGHACYRMPISHNDRPPTPCICR